MLFTAMLEPIFYHPFILIFSIRGNFKYFIGEKTWGTMDRVGFSDDEQDDKEKENNNPEIVKGSSQVA